MQDFRGTTINPILHHPTVNNNNINPTQIKDNRRSSPVDSTASLHASPTLECAGIRPDPRCHLTINGANDADELTRLQNIGLCHDERPSDDQKKG